MKMALRIGLVILCYAASAMVGLLFAGWWAAFAAPCLLACIFLAVLVRPAGGLTTATRSSGSTVLPVVIEDDEWEPSSLGTSFWCASAGAISTPEDDDFHPGFSFCPSNDAFPDMGWQTVNPATGLPMVGGMGGVDVGGHIYGSSD